MNGAFSYHGKDEICIQSLVRKLKGSHHLEDLGTDERINMI
jgi:hypothetical protein